jgi:nicotinate-nucleotide adenylyltransferase
LALEIRERLDLRSVRLIPLNIPPHRDAPVAAAALRLAMLEAAVLGTPGLTVDARELRRDTYSYTVDTLAELRQELGAVPLCLIMGRDAFLGLPSWHRWEALIEFAHIVVADRPAAEIKTPEPLVRLLEQHRTRDSRDLRVAPAGRIFELECPKLDISASAIRASLTTGRDPRYLLPDSVLTIIREHKLYQDALTHDVIKRIS